MARPSPIPARTWRAALYLIGCAANLVLYDLSLPISDEREKQQSVQTVAMTMEYHHALSE